jgi:hypothetical protein
VSCTHCRASHHGLAGKASEISHSFLTCLRIVRTGMIFVSVVVVGDACSLKHQANSLSGWDSSPPCKRCGFCCPPSHASVNCSSPPNYCGGHWVNRSFQKLWVLGLDKSSRVGTMDYQVAPVTAVRESPSLN